MKDIEDQTAQYIIEVDRAVTAKEVSKEIEVANRDEIQDILESLLSDDYLTADIFGRKSKVTRYYPTNKLIQDFK
jgi:hypothetical protein